MGTAQYSLDTGQALPQSRLRTNICESEPGEVQNSNFVKDNDDSFPDLISICAAWTWYPDDGNNNCFLFESDEREPENCKRWGFLKYITSIQSHPFIHLSFPSFFAKHLKISGKNLQA